MIRKCAAESNVKRSGQPQQHSLLNLSWIYSSTRTGTSRDLDVSA